MRERPSFSGRRKRIAAGEKRVKIAIAAWPVRRAYNRARF